MNNGLLDVGIRLCFLRNANLTEDEMTVKHVLMVIVNGHYVKHADKVKVISLQKWMTPKVDVLFNNHDVNNAKMFINKSTSL